MVKLFVPEAVWVPFEWDGKTWIKRDDLPRFLEPPEIITYLATHPQVSFRKGVPVRLDWMEHSERDLIREYTDGVGTPEFLIRNQRH